MFFIGLREDLFRYPGLYEGVITNLKGEEVVCFYTSGRGVELAYRDIANSVVARVGATISRENIENIFPLNEKNLEEILARFVKRISREIQDTVVVRMVQAHDQLCAKFIFNDWEVPTEHSPTIGLGVYVLKKLLEKGIISQAQALVAMYKMVQAGAKDRFMPQFFAECMPDRKQDIIGELLLYKILSEGTPLLF
jgi:GMP synthase PP-ATPase subunit